MFLHYECVSRESCSRSTQRYYTWRSINDYHNRKINILDSLFKIIEKICDTQVLWLLFHCLIQPTQTGTIT